MRELARACDRLCSAHPRCMDTNELPSLAPELLIGAVVDGDANATGVVGDVRERLWLTKYGALVVTDP